MEQPSQMREPEVRLTIHNLLIDHFAVDKMALVNELPLEVLQPDFKILGYLLFLEQLINKEYDAKIPLLENINAAIHTPADVVELILNQKM